MATTPKVLLKRSSVAGRIPSAGDLSYGELAINFADGKIYYKNSSNAIRAFVDSARVQAIADAVEIVAESQLDSAEVTSLVDSAYVQARVPLSYLESLIDSDYVQARQIYYTGFDSDFDARLAIKTTDDLTEGSNLYYTKARVDSDIATSLNDSGNVVNVTINNTILDTVDSAYVNARVNAANYLDSAEAIQLIDSAYVQARQITYDFLDSVETVAIIDSHVNKTFVDALNIDADRLDGQHGNYYLDWNNTTNKPTILDLVDVSTQITADVDKAFVDALNVDADTVDGYHAQAFFDAIDSAVDALIDGAPGALDTLNELAQALNDDSNAYNNLLSLIAAKLDSAEAIALIDSAHVRARQDYAYSSLTGVPTNVSTFTNDANYLDSNTVVPIIDSAYIQARQLNFDNLLDSAEVIALVDSAYVQARQDYAYSSLTGVPTNVSQFTNDANYLDSSTVQNVIDATYIQANQITYDFLDSAEVTAIVDSAYVQARQDYAYGSLTGVPTNVSTFTNDANYLDSATVQGVIDSAYIKARTDSAYVTNIIDNATSVFINNVDSAYVQARQITYNTSNFTDSAFVTGLPVSTFTNDANYLDSTTVTDVIDSAYVRARVRTDQDLRTTDSVTFSGLTISGDLNVTGNTYSVQSVAYTINDPLIHLADSNEFSDVVDIGFIGHYYRNAQRRHAGVFRDASDEQFYIFNNMVDSAFDSTAPPNTINRSSTDFQLATLNVGNIYGQYQGFDSDFNTKSTSDLTEGTNLYYTKARADSDIAASLNDSGNTVNITINTTIEDKVDSAYVLARVAEAPFLDSADAIQLIDSAYVLARVAEAPFLDSADAIQLIDSAYVQQRVSFTTSTYGALKLMSATTDNVADTFTWTFDTDVQAENFREIVQGAVQPGSSAGTNMFFYDAAGYFYRFGPNISATPVRRYQATRSGTAVVVGWDSSSTDMFTSTNNPSGFPVAGVDLIQMRSINDTTSPGDFSDRYELGETFDAADIAAGYYGDSAQIFGALTTSRLVDSDDVIAIHNSLGIDSDLITQLIDSAYVQQRQADGLDSANVSNIISTDVDQAFVNALNVDADNLDGQTGSFYLDYNNFTNIPNILDSQNVIDLIDTYSSNYDSANTIGLIDSAYIQARQADIYRDSGFVTSIIDSAYINARTSGIDSAAVTSIIDSAYVAARAGAGTDSATVINLIQVTADSAYIQARQLNETAAQLTQTTYSFSADSGQTSFTGLDVDSGKFQVYLNGLLLPRADYTHNSSKVDLLVAADSADVLEVIKFSGNNIGLDSAQVNALISATPSGTDSASVLTLINDYIVQADSDLTTTSADQVIDTFSATTYRTAKYLVQFSHAPSYHSTEVLLVHDGTTVYMTEYAEVKTDSNLGTIDADISGGNVRLKVTPALTNTGVNVTRINVTV